MTEHILLTADNYQQLLESQPYNLEHGDVSGYAFIFDSHPQSLPTPVDTTEAIFHLRLDIQPRSTSNITNLYITFVPDGESYDAVTYTNKSGYVSKPMTQYNAIIDMLKGAAVSGNPVQVFLQINTDGRNAVVIT